MIYLFDRAKKLQKIIPRKHIINATQTKVRNGIYQLAVEVPIFYEDKKGTQYNYQKSVGKATFAGHYDVNNRFQLYKIHSRNITANEQGEFLIFDGVHIFFDEAKAMGNIHDRRFRDSEAKAPADVAFNSIGWTVIDYDVTDRHNINFYRASVTDAWNDLISTYGVEFDYELQFDGRKIISKNIIMKKQIGQWTGQRFAYGTNVLTLTQEQDESEVYTAAVGRGRGEESGDGFGPRLEFGDIAWSKDGITKPVGQNYIELPSATAEYGFIENGVVKPRIAPEVVFENIEDKKKLADSTYYWLLENCLPKATWKTEVARIGNLKLGDTVGVLYKAAGIIKRARVEKIEYNLLDPELSKLTLGDFHHFENRQMKRINAQIKRLGRDSNDRITRIKNEWNAWIDNQFTAAMNQFEQNLIDQKAQIEADRENMTNKIEDARIDLTDAINTEVTQAKDYAEQQAQAKADSVQTNLDSFKDSHQQLYDEVNGNILDIDTFLGDKSKTLKQQFDKVRTDLGTLQTDLDGVESDLTATKTDLQKQLDEARSELDGLEVGGRNLLLRSKEYEKELEETYSIYDQMWRIPLWSAHKHFKLGDEITISFDVQMQRGEYLQVYDNNGHIGFKFGAEVFRNIGSEKQRISITKELIEPSRDLPGIWHLDFFNGDNGDKFIIENVMITKGNVDVDYQQAPEDTEQKITTLNQQIEFIDGQLSAKLEQTDLLPINNKITEYGNSLTANAQSIESLISKTELHDGDITKWSNQTTANAESITSALSRISNTESGLTKAQTDITANADGLSTLITRVNKTETGIESLTTDLSIEAGKVETLITKTDGHASQLTNIVADYKSIEQTVAANDDWLGTHGSNLLQTVDGFEQKVWLSDVANINPNLITYSDVTNSSSLSHWEPWYADYMEEDYEGWLHVRNNNTDGTSVGIQSPKMQVYKGRTYTVSWESWISSGSPYNIDFNYMFITSETYTNTGIGTPQKVKVGEFIGRPVYRYTLTFEAPWFSDSARILFGTRRASGGIGFGGYRIRYPKLEEGISATPYTNAYANLEVKADEINQAVTELDGSVVKQSQVKVQSDRILIGSQSIGTSTLASIIAISPTSVDIITDAMNLTGNLNVRGQIEAITMSAISANFSEVQAAVLKASVIKTLHLDSEVVTASKLKVDSALVDKLIANSIMVNEIKALSIDVVDANISNIRSKILTSNVIMSDNINASLALIDKIFSENMYVSRMTGKSAFITEIKAIEISANKINGGVLSSIDQNMTWDLINNIQNHYVANTVRFHAYGNATTMHKSNYSVGMAFLESDGKLPRLVIGGNSSQNLQPDHPAWNGIDITPDKHEMNITADKLIFSSEGGVGSEYLRAITIDLYRGDGQVYVTPLNQRGYHYHMGTRVQPWRTMWTEYINNIRFYENEFGIFIRSARSGNNTQLRISPDSVSVLDGDTVVARLWQR